MRKGGATIRPARPDELPRLAAIEDAAEELFRGTAMAFVLDMPKPPVRSVPEFAPGVMIWAATDAADAPLGFIEAERHDDWLHLQELSVHPEAQRQGLGRALVMHALAAARAAGLAWVSLTTDREIAWNGPFYRRMGFAELAPEMQPGWLADMLRHEVEAGFDPKRRVAMARRP